MTTAATQRIESIVDGKKHVPGALLPILHDIQEALGYIPAQSVDGIAKALNMSRAEVHGVVSFYHHFRTEPPGQTVVQVCRAEACQSMGGERLWEHACRRLDVHGHGGTTADAAVTLLPVYCLGLCSSSPAMSVGEKLYARVDANRFDSLVDAARSAT